MQDYEFLTFNHNIEMRDPHAKKRIRKHAMKAIGSSKRRLRPQRIFPLEFRPPINSASTPPGNDHFPYEDSLPVADNKALYNPTLRALSCQVDPFGSASIRVDSTTQGLLQYFTYYSSFPDNFTWSPAIGCTIESAFRDDLLMHCILGAAASRILYVSGLSATAFKTKELASTQQGLQLLQHRLAQPAAVPLDWTERLVNCMLYLGAGAIYRRDLSSAKIHINAALNVAEAPPIGGVKNLRDPQVLVRALSLDDLLACLELRPCRVSCCYDPGPRYVTRDLPHPPNTPSHFAATGFLAKDNTILPPLLKALILQVLECYEAHCNLEAIKLKPPISSRTVAARHWIIMRTLSARNRLLSFKTTNDQTEALRVALIVWTLLPPSDLRQIKTAQVLTGKVRDTLGLVADWAGQEDIRLWCLTVGYFAAQEPSDMRTWFAKEICRSIELNGDRVGIPNRGDILDDLVAFQRRFLFREPALFLHTEKLAKYVARRNGLLSLPIT